MLTLNLKALTSAAGALVVTFAVTTLISWMFVDASKLAYVQRDASFAGTVSALVR